MAVGTEAREYTHTDPLGWRDGEKGEEMGRSMEIISMPSGYPCSPFLPHSPLALRCLWPSPHPSLRYPPLLPLLPPLPLPFLPFLPLLPLLVLWAIATVAMAMSGYFDYYDPRGTDPRCISENTPASWVLPLASFTKTW